MPIVTVLFEHQPNFPPKSALNKNDNFAQCAKQSRVFEKWSSLKNENTYVDQNKQLKERKKTKLRKGIWKAKQNRKPQKTEKIDENKPFKCNSFFFFVNKRKETRQEKTIKNKEGKNQQESKEKTKKNRKQDRERQRVKKEKWKKPRKKNGRHWEMNKITRFHGKTVFL